jgi:hypothetical protein
MRPVSDSHRAAVDAESGGAAGEGAEPGGGLEEKMVSQPRGAPSPGGGTAIASAENGSDGSKITL